MIEIISLHFNRFRSPDGKRTCCLSVADHPKNVCQFLGVRRFGTQDVCMFGEQVDLQRDEYTRPHDKCELWKTP